MLRVCFVGLIGLAALLVACEEPGEPPIEADAPDPPDSPAAPTGVEVELLHVVDGDTIGVRYEGREERVRYIGIDTPEVDHEGGEFSEPFAEEATAANERLLGEGPLRLVFDVEHRDRYGRLLAYVFVGETMINEALLREGLAVVLTIPPNVRHAERFVAAQEAARAAEVGLWAP